MHKICIKKGYPLAEGGYPNYIRRSCGNGSTAQGTMKMFNKVLGTTNIK
jgi:hypothetical protein